MIPVPRPDLEQDAQWKDWHDKAVAATAAMAAARQGGQQPEIDDTLYKAAMPFLLRLFQGKCAYCETVIDSNQPGDVEHYRPKGRVVDDHGKVVQVSVGGLPADHPGYWWLAYEWRNLLPACIDCNRRRRHGDDRVAAGKADRFAVLGPRAAGPGDDLEQEQALLIDPSRADYDAAQHFEFQEDGKLKPKTEQARYSCELLGLNLRESLPARRQMAYLQAQQAFTDLLSKALSAPDPLVAIVRRQVNDLWAGRQAYGAFTHQALADVRRRLASLTGVTLPLPMPDPEPAPPAGAGPAPGP